VVKQAFENRPVSKAVSTSLLTVTSTVSLRNIMDAKRIMVTNINVPPSLELESAASRERVKFLLINFNIVCLLLYDLKMLLTFQ
jgi:hypothetical protein